jgi:ABC-type transporter Mla subunit MlaD
MTTPTKYWKLGLFIMAGLVVGVVALSYFGAGAIRQQTIEYRTYFDQSVEGITVGSPVRFRGVTMGRVDDIRVAPDKRHIEVAFVLAVKELRRHGLLANQDKHDPEFSVQPDMRMQLALTTIVGEQVLAIDFFDPETHPPPSLPFPPPERYIPSTPSLLHGVEDSLADAVSRLPCLIDRATQLVAEADGLMLKIDDVHLVDRTQAALVRLNALLGSLREVVTEVRAEQIPAQFGEALATLQVALARLDQLIEHVDGDHGLLLSAQRVTDALGDVARSSHGTGPRLDLTLREVRESAAAVRRVADALEHNPDMLLKGRSRGAP